MPSPQQFCSLPVVPCFLSLLWLSEQLAAPKGQWWALPAGSSSEGTLLPATLVLPHSKLHKTISELHLLRLAFLFHIWLKLAVNSTALKDNELKSTRVNRTPQPSWVQRGTKPCSYRWSSPDEKCPCLNLISLLITEHVQLFTLSKARLCAKHHSKLRSMEKHSQLLLSGMSISFFQTPWVPPHPISNPLHCHRLKTFSWTAGKKNKVFALVFSFPVISD